MVDSAAKRRWYIRFRVFWPLFAGGYPSQSDALESFARTKSELEKELAASLSDNSANTLIIENVSVSPFEPSGMDIVIALSDSSTDGEQGVEVMEHHVRRFAPIISTFVRRYMPGAQAGANAYELLSAEYWPERGWPRQVDVSEHAMFGKKSPPSGPAGVEAVATQVVPNTAHPSQGARLGDDEVIDLLNALAAKHVRLSELASRELAIRKDVEQLITANRLIQSVRDYSDRPSLDRELADVIASAPTASLVESLQEVGLVDALDDAPKRLFANIGKSVVPDYDLTLLRRAGLSEPNAELALALYAAQDFALSSRTPSGLFVEASEGLRGRAEQMKGQEESPAPRKRRKLFNGIGNIMAGLLTAGGNVLAFAGTIAAPNPATAYLAIGSAGAGVGFLFKGIGDLRGE